MLQDSFDQVQAEAKFEADQTKQQLQERQQEVDSLKAQLMVGKLKTVSFDHVFSIMFALDFNVIKTIPCFIYISRQCCFKINVFICVFYSLIVGIK